MAKPSARQPRMSVSIIGAGRLGQALALALSSTGYAVQALVARRASRAEKASKLLGLKSEGLGVNQLSRIPGSDLILITTPDDAIETTATRLAALDIHPKVVLHTSGALSSRILEPLLRVGVHTGSLHPLVSVSEPRSGAAGLRGAFYCIEGDAKATRVARRIVTDLEGKSFSIKAESKVLYHAAALTAAGHLTALIDLAIEMLSDCGLSQERAQEVLMPLVESAVGNLKAAPPAKVLTGTFARGDALTVKRHLEALAGQNESLAIYKLLGLRSLQMAGKKIDAETRKKITKLLQ